MVNVLISGARGKMGVVVAQYAATLPDDFTVVAGIDPVCDGEKMPFPIYASPAEVTESVDVIIDFSIASALPSICEFAKTRNIPAVLCSTGYTDSDMRLIDELAETVAVFQSSNMSLGVNLMIDFLQKAAVFFGDSVDIEIIEKHHNTKADAPSGTALTMAAAINEAQIGKKELVFGRRLANEKRKKSELGVHAVRGGTLVGEHEALFLGVDEVFSVSHAAQSRRIYAAGALKAAEFITQKPPRRYNMKDLLLENSTVTHMYIDVDVAMISAYNIAPDAVAKIFSAIAELSVNVDMISQTAPKDGLVDISFTLPRKDIETSVAAVKDICADYGVYKNVIKLTVEGLGMERHAGVAARVFELLAKQDITAWIITTSETKIALCIDIGAKDRAMEAMRVAFGL